MITERQKEILTVSIKLAAKNGVQALTIKNIASRMGFTEAALYRYFQSKRDIMLGIIELFNTSSRKDFEAISDTGISSIDELKSLIIRRIDQFEKFPEIAYLMLSIDIFMQDEALRLAAINSMHNHKEFILALIVKGQERKEIKKDADPKELFRIVFGSFRLLLTQWFLNGYSFDLKNEFESLWRTTHLLIKA